MAVTNKNKSLTALTAAALALPGLSVSTKINAAEPIEGPVANYRYSRYQESDNRMRVDIHNTSFALPLKDRFQLSGNVGFDTYAGATPDVSMPTNMVDVVSSASANEFGALITLFRLPEVAQALGDNVRNGLLGDEAVIPALDLALQRPVALGTKPIEHFVAHPREDRFYGNATASYFFNDVTVALTGGQSTEPDYKSSFGFANLNWEINQKLTTLNVGYGYTADKVSSATTDNIGGNRVTQNFQFGFTQITGKNSLFRSNVNYTRGSGFLTNAYKLVHIRGEITAAEYFAFTKDINNTLASATDLIPAGIEVFHENRPDIRHQWSVSNRLVKYVPKMDASIHLDYRYYTDSWNVDSHTFEVNWFQPVKSGWLLKPNIRYYTQSEADFFAPFFLSPREDGFYTSDFRLSSYGTISAGMQISKEFNQWVGIRGGYEYTLRRADLKIGGSDSDYADFDYYFTNIALFIKF